MPQQIVAMPCIATSCGRHACENTPGERQANNASDACLIRGVHFLCGVYLELQVQRLRSSELTGRNSSSPSGSPRGGAVGKAFDSPTTKVAKHSPGGSLRVDVENGIASFGKDNTSPMASPAAGCDSPVASGTGKKWEATTSRFNAALCVRTRLNCVSAASLC